MTGWEVVGVVLLSSGCSVLASLAVLVTLAVSRLGRV